MAHSAHPQLVEVAEGTSSEQAVFRAAGDRPAIDMARLSSCSWPPAAASRQPSSAVVHVSAALAWSLEPPWDRIVLTLNVVTCSTVFESSKHSSSQDVVLLHAA